MVVNWTAIAAFAAAGLSLVNVAYNYRLTRRGNLEQWRREQELPIIARILTLSADAEKVWSRQAFTLSARADIYHDKGTSDPEFEALTIKAGEQMREGRELYDRMRYEVAQLDLLAGDGVRVAAARLAGLHDTMGVRLRAAGPRTKPLSATELTDLRKRTAHLRNTARIELGIKEPRQFHGWIPWKRHTEVKSGVTPS
jgi:hypothetical protein